MSSMFISGWDNDEENDEDIRPKDLSDPTEQFLTAAEDGDLAKLQKMYKAQPEYLHAKDEDKYTALHRAAYNDHADVCRWLLSVGANPEQQTEDGWTALHCAACWANYNIVELLLIHGVQVNSRSHGHLTPLHLAINSSEDPANQIKTIKCLLNAPGVDLNAVTGAGDTPLMLARRVNAEITELLQKRLDSP